MTRISCSQPTSRRRGRRRRAIIALCLGASLAGTAAPETTPVKIRRELREWLYFNCPRSHPEGRAAVLMIGDSITNMNHAATAAALGADAYCIKFVTSAAIADPVFHAQLAAVLEGQQFAAVYFNNGLHGFDYTEAEYGAAYERTLRDIRDCQPTAAIIVALTTHSCPTGRNANLNPRVDARNRIARRLAAAMGLPVHDLNVISDGHPEFYRDNDHFTKPICRRQGEQNARVIRQALAARPATAGNGQLEAGLPGEKWQATTASRRTDGGGPRLLVFTDAQSARALPRARRDVTVSRGWTTAPMTAPRFLRQLDAVLANGSYTVVWLALGTPPDGADSGRRAWRTIIAHVRRTNPHARILADTDANVFPVADPHVIGPPTDGEPLAADGRVFISVPTIPSAQRLQWIQRQFPAAAATPGHGG